MCEKDSILIMVGINELELKWNQGNWEEIGRKECNQRDEIFFVTWKKGMGIGSMKWYA